MEQLRPGRARRGLLEVRRVTVRVRRDRRQGGTRGVDGVAGGRVDIDAGQPGMSSRHSMGRARVATATWPLGGRVVG